MLMYSLGPLAALYTTSQAYTTKVDLSHVNPMSVARYGKAGAPDHLPASSSISSSHSTLPSSKRCLQRLLAEYLHSCWPLQLEIDEAVGKLQARSAHEGALDIVFSDRNVEYICREGYGPEDLLSWAWILTANTTDRAIGRLIALVADSRGVPTFVFLSILRREKWSADALSKIIVHAWARLEESVAQRRKQMDMSDVSEDPGCHEKKPQKGSLRPMSESTIVIMVVRLLRQARKVWPEACIPIVAMLTKHVNGNDFGSMTGPRTPKATARLTFVYNTMLSMLALPTLFPYRSISVQLRAQFDILRRMNEFNPPLAIDREGYRAVTRLKLAHRKTPRERDWASLKAKSWPPWKEDKSGLDAHKGPQYGISGASEIRKRSEQAGYSAHQWELAADILAGWDTDSSPTIQKRKLLPRPIMSRRLLGEDEAEPSLKMDIWAARIEATRTIDEAWACFLAFKDARSTDRTKSDYQQVYHSIVEKLVFEEQRRRIEKREKHVGEDPVAESAAPLALPGDGKEVCEKPGPREAIYVRSSPPSVQAFIAMMRRDNVHLSPRLLNFLLTHASSFKAGIRYLNMSLLHKEVLKCLFFGDSTEIDELFNTRAITDHFFAALVQFLCRFAPQVRCEGLPLVTLRGIDHRKSQQPRINPLQQAFRLMGARKPFYRPPWNSLLTALAKKATSLEDVGPDVDNRRQDILSWTSITSVVRNMHDIGLKLDSAGFHSVCMGFQKTITACAQDDTKAFLNEGLSFIKRVFKETVSERPKLEMGGTAEQSEHEKHVATIRSPSIEHLLPRLLEVPTPAHLHPYVRILGLRGDRAGLAELLEWMAYYATEIDAAAEEVMNGKGMMRNCLVAARLFLEQDPVLMEHHLPDDSLAKEMDSNEHDGKAVGSNQLYIERCRWAVDENPQWGGWPTDEEVTMSSKADCSRDTYLTLGFEPSTGRPHQTMGHRGHCIAPLLARTHSALPCTITRLQIASQFKRSLLTKSPNGTFEPTQLIKVQDVPAPHIGYIRTISLNSPHNRNAISTLLLAQLRKEILKLKKHDGRSGGTRVLILASEIDEAFCAGADLKERARMSDKETNVFLHDLRSTLNDLSNLSIPTISVVTSNALGGGFEIALATHLRIFTNATNVGFPETQLGIIPGAGGTYRLRHLVGESRAHELVLVGRNIHGQQAHQWGICNWCIKTDKSSTDQKSISNDTEDVKESKPIMRKVESFEYKDGGARRLKALSFAHGVAKAICKGAPMAVAAALHSVKIPNQSIEVSMYKLCMTVGAEDRAEGLLAFKEKRLPRYKGASKPPKKAKKLKPVYRVSEEAKEPKPMYHVSEEAGSHSPRAEGVEGKVEDLEDVEESETLEDSEGSTVSEASDADGESGSETETSEMSEKGEESEESTARARKEQD